MLHGFDPENEPISGHPFTEQLCWGDWKSLTRIRSIVGSKTVSLDGLARMALKREQEMRSRLKELEKLIDEDIYRLYEISENDKKIIEQELALRSESALSFEGEETTEIDDEQIQETFNEEMKIRDHVARLLSFYIRKILDSNADGVVPLHRLVEQLRNELANDFGEAETNTKEKEIQKMFGKSLEEWIATEYFDFHVNLYKRRPVYWHLTSSNFSSARRSSGAVNLFIHYHKLDRDTVPKIISNYLKPEVDASKWKTERLKRELQEARDKSNKVKEKELSKQLETTLSVLEELQGFQEALETVHNPPTDKTKLPRNPTWLQQKTSEVRDNGYGPVIDYGVRVNIEPLKEAGLLHKAAQRVK